MDGWSRSSSRNIGHAFGLLCLLALAAFVSACGYSLAGRGSSLPASFKNIKTVAIPPIENRTPYSRVEQLLTERVRGEFIGRGKYTVVNDEAAAGADGASLRAQIVGFTLQPAGLNQQQLTSRYLVTIVLKVSFVDLTKPDQPLWSNDALTFRDEYDLGTTNPATGSLVDQSRPVVDRMSQDAARTIVTAIFEAF